MSLNIVDAKIKIKTSNVTGEVPVIGPSEDHTDGSWTGSTMVYDREIFYNAVDEKLWVGTNEIVTLGATGTVLRQKIIDIGDWDMDATATLNVAHGLSATEWKTIRDVSVIIRNDADTEYINLNTNLNILGTPESNYWFYDSTNVRLFRQTSGVFDSTDYDSTSYNRGWVTVSYTPD